MKNALLKILIIIAFLPLAAPVVAQKNVQNEQYKFSVPEGWTEIPQSVVTQYTNDIRSMGNDQTIIVPEYAFQRDNSPEWFSVPYILIIKNKCGKISESELNSSQTSTFQKVATDIEKDFSKFISKLEFGKYEYDSKRNIMWQSLSGSFKNSLKTHGISGAKPTEEGFIQISCYSSSDEYDALLPIFLDTIKSLNIHGAIKYRKSSTKILGLSDGKLKSIGLAILLGIIISGISILRKKKSLQ